jgi:hypothetical protein
MTNPYRMALKNCFPAIMIVKHFATGYKKTSAHNHEKSIVEKASAQSFLYRKSW